MRNDRGAGRPGGVPQVVPPGGEPRQSPGTSRSPSPASLLALLENVPAILWETDRELRLTCLAGTGLRLMNRSQAHYLGRAVTDLFSGARSLQVARAHELALRGERVCLDAEVSGRELRAHLTPLRGPGGEVEGVAGVALDLTERIVAERVLRQSEHGYRSLVEEAPYAICRATLGGELLQANRAMAEMLGYGPDCAAELLLRDLPAIFAGSGAFAEFQKTLLEHGSHPGADAVWLRRDGEEIQVRISGRVVRGGAGKASHLDVFAENVSERLRLQAELTQAQKVEAVGQLAGGVAHDLNNLLTVIGGNVELLLLAESDAASRERLGAVQEAAEKAAWLTRKLADLGRRQALRGRSVDVNETIGSLTGAVARGLREDVDLVFLPGAGVGSVTANPDEIQRVLLLLAANAQDAMPAGGRVTIRTAAVTLEGDAAARAGELPPGNYAEILVQESGAGLPDETPARAFEPLFTSGEAGGDTGVGLAVAYGIVRQRGGLVQVERTADAGAAFRILLPRAPRTIPPGA